MKRKIPEFIEVDTKQLDELVNRAEKHAFQDDDWETVRHVLSSYGFLSSALRDRTVAVSRLRSLLFGPSSEKADKVIGKASPKDPADDETAIPEATCSGIKDEPKDKRTPRKRGHGQNAASAYKATIAATSDAAWILSQRPSPSS